MPRLHVALPDGSQVTHELTDELITLGRVADNALQIEDASVSSHHAELISRGGDYVVKDLGSTNGTRLNGAALEVDTEYPLTHGDEVIFGHIPTAYMSLSETDEAAPKPLPTGAAVSPTGGAVPSDFTNASPFTKRKKETDTSGILVVLLGVLGLLAAGAAAYLIMGMQAPAI